ncbi:SDR family NAD(P)-dependent oxidoreductase [Streptomyces sp. NPDC018057]|uniref:SDR family NAD(P)-dependent oxidoreductase n=1 Tax=unclassified Streptomyces TaxID=2593676 RepID=UPI00378D2BB0
MNTTPRTVLLTGATDGLGRALAHTFAARGDTLIAHGRSAEKGAALLEELRAATGNPRLHYERADFSSLDQVRDLADRVTAGHGRLDVLVNNAGIGSPPVREESRDGAELILQVDYLAPYLLACRLAPLLARSAPARVVNVASRGQAPVDFDDVMLEHGEWDGMHAYARAKLALIAFTFDLAEQLRGTGVTVNAVHPASLMPTKMVPPGFPHRSTLEEGARHTLRLVDDPELAVATGRYYDCDRLARAHEQAYEPTSRSRLRALAESLTGEPLPSGASPGSE